MRRVLSAFLVIYHRKTSDVGNVYTCVHEAMQQALRAQGRSHLGSSRHLTQITETSCTGPDKAGTSFKGEKRRTSLRCAPHHGMACIKKERCSFRQTSSLSGMPTPRKRGCGETRPAVKVLKRRILCFFA